jgi:hypothetical protein
MKKDCSSRIIRPKHPYDDTYNIHNALAGLFQIQPIGGYCNQYGIFAAGQCFGLFCDHYKASEAENKLRMEIAYRLTSHAEYLKSVYESQADQR